MNKGTTAPDLTCFTASEVGELMRVSPKRVRNWIEAGLLKSIKAGHSMVVPAFELQRFQQAMLGKDISNPTSCKAVAEGTA